VAGGGDVVVRSRCDEASGGVDRRGVLVSGGAVRRW
jgi:hypothetical protein